MTKKNPTVSLIVPLKHMIEHNMASNEEDSPTVSNIKRAILNNLYNRYTSEYNHLLECTALDPRFRALPHLEKDQRDDVFHRLKEKAVLMLQNQVTYCIYFTLSLNCIYFTLSKLIFLNNLFIIMAYFSKCVSKCVCVNSE